MKTVIGAALAALCLGAPASASVMDFSDYPVWVSFDSQEMLISSGESHLFQSAVSPDGQIRLDMYDQSFRLTLEGDGYDLSASASGASGGFVFQNNSRDLNQFVGLTVSDRSGIQSTEYLTSETRFFIDLEGFSNPGDYVSFNVAFGGVVEEIDPIPVPAVGWALSVLLIAPVLSRRRGRA